MTPPSQKQDRSDNDYGRVLGLDYGSKTVGVAVSDPLRLTAQGVEIIRRKSENKLRQTLARICELASRYQTETIVLGFPRNMNATIGERAEAALAFGRMLKKRTHLPVVLWDERLTTVAADRIMDETGVRNHKAYVDELAAMLILQGYLDRLNAGLPVPGGIEDSEEGEDSLMGSGETKDGEGGLTGSGETKDGEGGLTGSGETKDGEDGLTVPEGEEG